MSITLIVHGQRIDETASVARDASRGVGGPSALRQTPTR